jgi:steroid 5-alpha reductase family enzyme
MKQRSMSFLWITIMYVVAILSGILTFLMLPDMVDIYRFLIADVVATLVIYLFSMLIKNASLYDPYWSVIPPLMFVFAAIYYGSYGLSVILMVVAISMWAIRLTYNWATLWTGFQDMDWRYERMKEKAPKVYFLTNLFGIQLFPTLIVFAQLALGLFVIQGDLKANLGTLMGALMIVIAAIIQFIADTQMKRFKARTQGEKKCIEEGLWKYSRHPNYFGELMVWWGLYVIYLSTHTFDIMIISPIMMTALFLFISIPWMEKKILKTRPEYQSYQSRVSMIIPFFRKKDQQETSIKEA